MKSIRLSVFLSLLETEVLRSVEKGSLCSEPKYQDIFWAVLEAEGKGRVETSNVIASELST